MTRITLRHLLVVALLAAATGGCAGTSASKQNVVVQRPPGEGLYVVYNGKMGRLDDAPDKVLKTWPIRSNLGPNLEFVIHHPAIAQSRSPGQLVALRQVAYVRANIATSGTVRKNKKAEWIVASLEPLYVPARVMQDSKDPTLLRVIPNEPLTPGLYALTLRTSNNSAVAGRFGVEWSKQDKEQYAAAHCVDRYLTKPVLYRPCDERDGVEKAALKVQALNVTKALVNSAPALVIEGRLKNTSSKAQVVPTMLAVLNDKQGKELKRWTFVPDAKELSPGKSVSFRTMAPTPPRGTAGVAILLAEND
jgi:hypothetical protein